MRRAADDAQFVATKVSSAVVADLAAKAAARGIPAYDEHERPGQSAITAVMRNFKHSCKCAARAPASHRESHSMVPHLTTQLPFTSL